MENVAGITEYLARELERTGGDARRGTLHFLRTRTGERFYADPDGGAWRTYPFRFWQLLNCPRPPSTLCSPPSADCSAP